MEQKYIDGDLVRIKTEPNNCTPNKVVYKFVDYVAIDKVLIRTINGIDRLVGKDRIVPTPITPEILEKNGWEKDEEASFKTQLYYRKKVGVRTIFVIIKEETSIIVYNSTCLRFIQYYHELQHLLFGLGLNHEMKVC